MEFRIASTFTDSLAKLTGAAQKVTKTTAFDLQLNPSAQRTVSTLVPQAWRTKQIAP